MNHKLLRWEIWGGVAAAMLGGAMHFFYQWSGQNPWVGLFAPVNESTWEHLKLLFFPVLLFTLAEYRWVGREFPDFFGVKLRAILLGMAVIVVLFYTYVGVIGRHFLAADILLFLAGVAISGWFSYQKLGSTSWNSPRGAAGLAVLLILFVLFSLLPPRLALFQNPDTAVQRAAYPLPDPSCLIR